MLKIERTFAGKGKPMENNYEPTVIDDLYDHAYAKMTEILGGWEPETLLGDIHDATDKALVVFRDLLDGAVLSQAGDYEDVGVRIAHAEHEISILLHALKKAKAALAAELAGRDK